MKIEKIKDIEFFNRDSEKEQIVDILKFNPRLITFVYGPINSGKTSLITNLVEELPDDYVVFYINLRGKFISDYEDFLRALFRVEKNKELKDILKELAVKTEKTIHRTSGLPVNESFLESLFKSKTKEDVFEFLEDYFKEIGKTRIPVLIIDELQVIGDLKIDDYLIYKLFNFFIRLTKELHLCHVFAISSDSLFIERVYSEAMLQERCKYLLVDEFDEQTAKKFLSKYKFSDKEIILSLKYAGGKPGHLIEIVDAKLIGKDMEKTALMILNIRKGEIQTTLNRVKQLGAEIIIENRTYKVDYDSLISALNKFNENDFIPTIDVDEITKTYLVKRNILFVDPAMNVAKPQSKIDLIAIRDVLKELKNN